MSGITSSLSNAYSTAMSWWNKIKSIFSTPIKAVVNIFKNEGKSMPVEQVDINPYARNNVIDIAKEMTYAKNAARASISESIESTVSSSSKNLLKGNIAKGLSSNNVTINNTYNSPKPVSIRELKRQDEIQMRRLAMQLGF